MKSTIHEYKKNNFKTMSKKLILIIALVLVSNTLFAQSVFDKFDNQDDITTIIVNKKMFTMLSKVDAKDKQSQQYINLIKKLDNLKVFVTANDKTVTVAIMCSESKPEECHRTKLIGEELKKLGINLNHITRTKNKSNELIIKSQTDVMLEVAPNGTINLFGEEMSFGSRSKFNQDAV